MKHLTNTIFIIHLFFSSIIFAVTPEIQQAIEMWENGKESEAFPIFLKYKDGNDADALAYLGRSYMNGKGVEKNTSLAYEYFSKAAAQGQPYGLNGVGVCYRNGYGVKQDLQKAEKYFLQAAQVNCPLAEFNLGILYQGIVKAEEGTPTLPDIGNGKKAMEHFRASYDAGNLKPQCAEHIGLIMLNGETPWEAIRWLQEAADGNQIASIMELASIYENGRLGEINHNYAIDYAEKLGKLMKDFDWIYGDICYRTGIEYLFRKQRREAMLFLQMAADAGHGDAQYQLALNHPDDRVCSKYAVMAARNGNRLLFVRAGTYLAQQKQFDEAMKFYLEAVKDGNLQAMCEIAIMHRVGEGVPVDYEKAMEWYAKAAAQYYPRALRELGVKYQIKHSEDPKKEFYKDIPPNLSKAYAFMAMAVFMGGDDSALEYLPTLPFFHELQRIVPADSDMELAKGLISICFGKEEADLDSGIKLLEASVSHGNVDAMNMLGHLFFIDGPRRNLQKSAEYFKKAAAKGNDYASEQLCGFFFAPILGEKEFSEYLVAQADKGYEVALYNLADSYMKQGDLQKALELHLKNAKKGNDHSITQLYLLSASSKSQLLNDAELGKLLDQAVKRHDSVAEYMEAGLMEHNLRESATLFMRSILDGAALPGAWHELGELYLQGKGVRRDPEFAVELFENAIRAGYWEACITLGDIMSKGEYGIPKDIEHAKELFKIGAEHGVEDCKERLDKIQTK
jgi:TPR repeat protein